jgi:hypothetical protein
VTNWLVSKPQGPNLVSPNGYEGGFEVAEGQLVFVPDAGDAGTMTLTQPQMLPPGWQAVNQIQWLSDKNTRSTGDAPLHPGGRGKAFPRPHEQPSQPERRVVTLIRTKPGRRYEVSLSLGTNENRHYSCGPVQVTVQAIGRYAPGKRVLGKLVFPPRALGRRLRYGAAEADRHSWPNRPPNSDLGTREYLTEVERLMDAAKRDATPAAYLASYSF